MFEIKGNFKRDISEKIMRIEKPTQYRPNEIYNISNTARREYFNFYKIKNIRIIVIREYS